VDVKIRQKKYPSGVVKWQADLGVVTGRRLQKYFSTRADAENFARAFKSSLREDGIAGYALSQMISYYLLTTLVDAFTAVAEDDWQIAADIKDGHISQFLIRPINYLGYRFTLYLSGRSIYTVVALVPVGIFLFFLSSADVGRVFT
jgi:ABC-type uncharacterized transport system permease subunit